MSRPRTGTVAAIVAPLRISGHRELPKPAIDGRLKAGPRGRPSRTWAQAGTSRLRRHGKRLGSRETAADTVGYSRKCVRVLPFRSSSWIWAALREWAFRRLGRSPRWVDDPVLADSPLHPPPAGYAFSTSWPIAPISGYWTPKRGKV